MLYILITQNYISASQNIQNFFYCNDVWEFIEQRQEAHGSRMENGWSKWNDQPLI